VGVRIWEGSGALGHPTCRIWTSALAVAYLEDGGAAFSFNLSIFIFLFLLQSSTTVYNFGAK
jgi:hypothetical protein